MRKLVGLALTAGLSLSAAAQTVTVTLSSPQDGQVLSPGATVDWEISFTVSGDNAGLALLVTDLVQDPENVALLDIPPADGVPAPMAKFSRPLGISNPGEDDPITGYIGVQRGAAGAQDLIQIGGGQNNFGVAQPPGTGIAENAVVSGGIGQSGSEVLASGSFTVPSGGCGAYTFSLANTLANVVTQINSPPNFSPVTEAAVVLANGSISFSVGFVGDVDGDGAVGLADLSALLTNFGLTGPDLDGDLDNDNDVDLADLSALLTNFGLSC